MQHPNRHVLLVRKHANGQGRICVVIIIVIGIGSVNRRRVQQIKWVGQLLLVRYGRSQRHAPIPCRELVEVLVAGDRVSDESIEFRDVQGQQQGLAIVRIVLFCPTALVCADSAAVTVTVLRSLVRRMTGVPAVVDLVADTAPFVVLAAAVFVTPTVPVNKIGMSVVSFLIVLLAAIVQVVAVTAVTKVLTSRDVGAVVGLVVDLLCMTIPQSIGRQQP